MADTPIDERRFTDQEVRQILKKAVEKGSSRALVKGEGLSLAELKSIGEEVGIDPHRLEDAARLVVAGGGSRRSHMIWGGPTVVSFERRVDGEFDPDDSTEILSRIRRAWGRHGEVTELRGALEWKDAGEAGERFVTVSARDGTTTVSGSSNLSNAAIVTYLPAGIVGLVVSLAGLARFVKAESEIGLILFFTVLPVLYMILRTIYGKVSESESVKLRQAVDDVARLTGGS